MQDKLVIHIGLLPDGYCTVEVFVPENVNVRKLDSDLGYEAEPLKQRDEEDEGILYDNLD